VRVLLFVVVAVLVNLPYAQERWTDHQVETKGIDVVAVVVNQRELNDKYLVDYLLPEDVDPAKTVYSAAVDLPTYENAVASERMAVRVVKGNPDANRPLGLVPSSFFTLIAVVADLVLVAIALGAWWRRRNPGRWASDGGATDR